MTAISSGPRAWRLPVLAAFAGYKPSMIGADLVAGVTLAAVAIPEQMATARLAGMAPQAGFFAFVVAGAAFAIFGASRRLSCGADSTIAPIFAGALAALAAAGSPHYGALAAALALLVGALVAGAGALKLGWIGDLLSAPVTAGFLAGVAVHILVSQAPAALGLPLPGGGLPQRILALARMAPGANLVDAALAGGVLLLIAGAHRISARLPGPLVALVLATGLVWGLHLAGSGVALLGEVRGGLPSLSLPALGAGDWPRLLPTGLLVALVVIVQTAATSRAFPADGAAPRVDRDMVGVGVGSLFAGLVGAFPVDASPPRTAIVAESGGRSQAAGLTAVAVVLALLVGGTALLRSIPTAALAGVLLFVATRLVRLDQIRATIRQSPGEALLILATAGAIIALPIQDGVAVGVALSLLHGVWSAARTRVSRLVRAPGTTIWWPSVPGRAGEGEPGVVVEGFQSPLTFLNADAFCTGFMAAVRAEPAVRLAVLEAAGITDIDITAAGAITGLLNDCKAAGVVFAVARLESPRAQGALTRLGLRGQIGEDRIFDSVEEALESLGGPEAAPDRREGEPA